MAISAEQPDAPDAGSLYQQRCATCHENATGRMPTRAVLRELPPESIVISLTNGAMVLQANGMNRDEIRAVAGYLSAKPFGGPQVAMVKPNPCKDSRADSAEELRRALRKPGQWNGWGPSTLRQAQDSGRTQSAGSTEGITTARFQPDPGLRARDVPKLKMKWAYAYDGRFAQGQPSVVGGRLFVSDTLGTVSALDAKTACEHWQFKAPYSVKVAIVVGEIEIGREKKAVAFFGDERSSIYAVDAVDGSLLWKTVVDTHPAARTVGSLVLHEGRLYVPVSSAEEGASRDPKYKCCTFRGAVLSLNAADGKILWKSHAIEAEPKPYKMSTEGSQLFGPAGGAIWSAPTLDARRGVIYAATGNSYTDVPTDGSNAIVAFDLATGARKWVNQVTASDNFVLGCNANSRGVGNCPVQGGPDVDFGASVILKTLRNGRQLVLAGQKSGMVYALDPDAGGKVVWQMKTGQGSALGGIEWGMAADDEYLYVANSDANVQENGMPGLTALRIADGLRRWHVPTPTVQCSWGADQCRRGQPGAVTAMPGVVFSGALDGHLRAYDAKDGSIIWDVDTAPPVQTVNGGITAGGALDQGGVTIADGVVYVNSGYGRWGRAGRLLLAFSVDGK
jgi:polyvinyl alcohol dehydrogenase (cytochrome)